MSVFDVNGNLLLECWDVVGSPISKLFDIQSNVIDMDYVTDGLALWLDGEWNSGMGNHISNATTWADISGCGHNFQMNNVTTSDKCMIFDGSSSYCTYSGELSSILSQQQNRTIEIVCKLSDTGSPQVIFLGQGSGSAGIWYRPASNGYHFYTNTYKDVAVASPLFNQTQSLSAIYGSDGAMDLYQNVDMKRDKVTGGTMSNSTYITIGARYYNSKPGYFTKGEIYAIRVYNRQLTAAEQLKNFLIDKRRFGIVNSYEKTVMSFNVQRWQYLNKKADLMSSIFEKYNPDIVGFQEYDTDNRLDNDMLAKDYLGTIWPHLAIGVITHGVDYAKAIASHHPIVETSSTDYAKYPSEKRGYDKAYITVGDKRIAVFNTHLSISGQKTTDTLETYKVLQSEELLDAVASEPYFIIFADMNTRCDSKEEFDNTSHMIGQFLDMGYKSANCANCKGCQDWVDGGSQCEVCEKVYRTYFNKYTVEGSNEKFPTDQIITSPNISIRSVSIDMTKIGVDTSLLLDHLPLIAHVTIS